MVLPHTYRSLMRWKSSLYCFIPAAKRYCRLDCMSDVTAVFLLGRGCFIAVKFISGWVYRRVQE